MSRLFFGQNFGWLTGHITTFAAFIIYGIGGSAVPLATLLWWLRRRRADPLPGTGP
jgi:magnesium transporter